MISVFTPTFNRADKLHRVWDSLLAQTYKDFEWVIIDDGSEDNIVEVVEQYQKQAPFPVIFHKFEKNKGKHNATNKALELATRYFFVVADSDDAFTEDALQFFMDGWWSIPAHERNEYCGIRACCSDNLGNRYSDTLAFEPLDASMSEAFYVYNFRAESWCMVRTDLHRQFLFKENHIGLYPEGIIWKAMSQNHKLRFYNKATRIYFVEQDPNSLTYSKKPASSKIGRNLIGGESILNEDMNFFSKDPLFFIKIASLYGAYSVLNKSVPESYANLRRISAKLLFIFTAPLAFVIYLFRLLPNR